MKNDAKKIIVIVGPTASGKTGWGVEIAKKFNGEIISADSRQVYRRLDIGTGKDSGEYGKVRYHLIDICEPGEKFTLFDWLKLARRTIKDIFERGKLPVVVGGTGLYVQALCEGFHLSEKLKVVGSPKAKGWCGQSEKKYTRQVLEQKTLKELQEICSKLAFDSNKLDFKNPRRLIRAIERAQDKIAPTKRKPDFKVLQIGIDIPREKLYKKIDRRVDERFEGGMLGEVQNLIESGVDPNWLLNLGLEYKIITSYIMALATNSQASNSFDKMSEELKYKIHAYARRQLTWLRRFKNIRWLDDLDKAKVLTKKFLDN